MPRNTLGRNSLLGFLWTFAVLETLTLARAQGSYTIEPAPLPVSADLPSAIAELLEPQGVRLIRQGTPRFTSLCEVWWRKATPVEEALSSSPESLYGNLGAGTAIGVLHILTDEAEDSFHQKIRPGFYSMRYALIPQDSMPRAGKSSRHFVLLSPLDQDLNIDERLSLKNLLTLSRQASGTELPAAISLLPLNPAYKKLPAVVADDMGHCTLQIGLNGMPAHRGRGEDIKVAILLLTPPEPHAD